jgi:hypothetical protein
MGLVVAGIPDFRFELPAPLADIRRLSQERIAVRAYIAP